MAAILRKTHELMRTEVLSVHEDDPVEDVLEVLVAKRLHGAPVLDSEGNLVGMISQQDVFLGSATRAGGPGGGLRVSDVMTSPAVTVTEDTDLRRLCETLYSLRLHRVPVVRDGRVVGIVSSLDICRALGQGKAIA